jgi:sulfatase maturation enzyme AslB (radical SAM superfamily)
MSATTISEAVDAGQMSGMVWLYTNYHCNLACSYCLTESAPKVDPRLLERDQVMATATQARELGFAGLGITGGEPFLLPWLPDVIGEVARILPVTVLSNGTLFTDRMVERLRPLADLPVRIQISLDRPDPIPNDEMRGPRNFAKVMEAIPRLVDAGLTVRIATTLEYEEIQHPDLTERERLCRMFLAMSAFYDPDSTAFRNMRLPGDPYTAELAPERWANWLRHDPVVLVDERSGELLKLKAIWLDCGSRDQFRMHFGMRRFHRKLERYGVPHVYEEFDDDHTDVDYRMDRFLPFLARALST